MYSSAYVWAKVLGHMESRLTPQVVSTWFDDTEILELTDEKLVLYSPSSFRKDIILRRCVGYIKEAMQEIFQLNVDVVVLDDTEIEAYRGKSQKPEFIEFNPQFTFDNFIVGNSNRFANAAAVAVMYFLLFFVGGIVISTAEGLPLSTCLYETASAVGTVGLTLGITPQLGVLSQLILIVLMYLGRVGGLTLIYAAISNKNQSGAKLPLENITVG